MKLSICILAHHKPWLMMSSLVSLAMQSDHDFDVHVIYIKGNGDNREKKSYKEFYEILDRTKDGNPQLSEDNKKILDIVQERVTTLHIMNLKMIMGSILALGTSLSRREFGKIMTIHYF